MKQLIHEIHKGKNLSANLNRYRDMAVPVYNEYASLELTFSAYTMLQEIEEEKRELAAREGDSVERLLAVLRDMSGERPDYVEIISRVRKLREEITGRMDLFTAYTDRLIVYEYVMNRMEFSFQPEKEVSRTLAAMDEELFLNRFLAWIFADRDQSVVRDKLRLAISQIPVHVTKAKLFERIRGALTLYTGGDKSSLEDFLYMIRTSAMLYQPARYVGEYRELEEVLREFGETDFSALDEKRYGELAESLERGARYAHGITDFYYTLQKVVNAIYALCLSMPYGGSESKLILACKSIWRCLAGREYRDEMLVPLEGRIESYVEKTSYLEAVLFEIKSSYKEETDRMGLTPFFEDFSLVANLLSDSLFIDLDRLQEAGTADAATVRKCTEKLLDELSGRLSGMPRPVRQAVTGQILEKLPLPFERAKDVEKYIRVNLLGCQNKAEKLVVMTMLTDLMNGT